MSTSPKHLTLTEAFWTSYAGANGYHLYGLRYADGSHVNFGATRDGQEAHDKAQALAEEHGVPATSQDRKPRVVRRERAAEHHRQRLQEIASTPLEFLPVEELRAVPTLGGILSDQPYERTLLGFPEEVLLPVSRRLAERFRDKHGLTPEFVVVEYEGRGVAITPLEAEAYGLSEAPNWVPDLTGAPCVPYKGDLEAVLARQA